MANVIGKNSLLSNRYLITNLELETRDGDRIYEAVDQVLGRHVNIFIPPPSSQDQVIDKAKNYAQGRAGNHISILDISALNASQLFIVTTTAAPQKILDALKPSADSLKKSAPPLLTNPPKASENDPPYKKFALRNLSLASARQGPKTERLNLFDDDEDEDDEEENTGSHNFIKNYLAAEEEEQTIGTSIPIPTASHDFIIPFHTESHPIINLGDDTQENDISYGEISSYFEGKRRIISTSWILGTALIVLTLALAYAGTYFLAQALQTAPASPPNKAAQATASAGADHSNDKAGDGSENNDAPLEIVGVTRSIDGAQDAETRNTSQLSNIISPNSGVWSTLQYSDDTFGGFFTSLTLNLELKEKTAIHEISIDQQETTGGMFTVYASDNPTPDSSAQEIAQGSFTGPNIKLPLSKEIEAKYVHVTFTQLPKLQNPNGSYPYGIRLSQVSVS